MSAPRGAKFAVAAFAGLLLGACSFVQMAPGADQVRVVGPGQLPAGCVKRGEVEVSVKDKLGPYERDEMRVKDELETLARNEAPGLGADTVQPKSPPADGGQRFMAFHCGATAPTPAAAPANGAEPTNGAVLTPDADHPAETTPLKDE